MSEYLGNMLPLRYANLYEENGWKVHVCEPGLTPTKLEGTGWTSAHVQTVEGGCTELSAATLGSDGETGTHANRAGPTPW